MQPLQISSFLFSQVPKGGVAFLISCIAWRIKLCSKQSKASPQVDIAQHDENLIHRFEVAFVRI